MGSSYLDRSFVGRQSISEIGIVRQVQTSNSIRNRHQRKENNLIRRVRVDQKHHGVTTFQRTALVGRGCGGIGFIGTLRIRLGTGTNDIGRSKELFDQLRVVNEGIAIALPAFTGPVVSRYFERRDRVRSVPFQQGSQIAKFTNGKGRTICENEVD